MSPLVARFVRWRRRRPVSLDEAVLMPRPWRYARWRLRYLVLRAVLLACAHLVEVTFFYDIFSVRYFVSVLGLYYAYTFGSALWWGALEPARREVRRHLRAGSPGRAAQALRPWLLLSFGLAAAVLALAVGIIAVRMSRVGVFSVFDLSTAALLGRLALEIVLRTYQAGVQATRRIYRPMWAVVGLDLLDVLGVVLLWPWLGPFAFGAVYCFTALASTALVWLFTARAYRRSAVVLPSLLARRVPWGELRALAGSALASGLANALARADAVMLLWLLWTRAAPAQGILVAALLHLGAPALHLCLAWPRPYALDVAWQGRALPALLQRRFRAQLIPVAVAVAALAWALAALVALSLAPMTPSLLAGLAALVPVAVLWSLAARAQVIAFMEGRAPTAALAAGVPAAGLLATVWALVEGAPSLGLAAAALTVAAVWLLSRAVRVVAPPLARCADDVLPPLRLLHALADAPGPVQLAVLAVDRGLQVQAPRLAASLARELPAATVGLLDQQSVALFAPVAAPTTLSSPGLAAASAGLVRAVRLLEAKSGTAALEQAITRGWLGAAWRRELAGPSPTCDEDTLPARYRRGYPDGLLLAERSGGLPLGQEGRAEARALLRSLRAFLQGRRTPPAGARWELSAYAPRGEPRLVFALPRALDPARRRAWREELARLHRAAVLERLVGRG